ncbi:helix-turn-helix domain-containing protein [Nocardia sp. NBC_00403]|uniref:helix-turn-helix domain-containing protein n=1 Tax=Nocardia sp. NBC_00403 TaxID=2975990 RepID=UPI002E21920B
MREDKALVPIGSSEIQQARDVKALVERLVGSASTSKTVDVVVGPNADQHVRMPAELAKLVMQVVDLVSRGCTITVGSIPNEVTTTTAAQMLRVSRPTLMKLIKDGKIASHKVGSHARLYSKDVLAYRRSQLAAQSKAFDELRALEDELGVID